MHELDGPESVATGAAYVLYYKRKDFYPGGNVDFNEIRNKIEGTEYEVITANNSNVASVPA